MAWEAHDIRLGKISKWPGREQSARVLLSAQLRSINTKKLANIDGVAQDEYIPELSCHLRSNSSGSIWTSQDTEMSIGQEELLRKEVVGCQRRTPQVVQPSKICLQLGIGPEAMNDGQYHQTGLRNAKPLKKRNGGWHGEGCQNRQHQYHRLEKMKVGLKSFFLRNLFSQLVILIATVNTLMKFEALKFFWSRQTNSFEVDRPECPSSLRPSGWFQRHRQVDLPTRCRLWQCSTQKLEGL